MKPRIKDAANGKQVGERATMKGDASAESERVHDQEGWRGWLRGLVEGRIWELVILTVIILNAAVLGLDTSSTIRSKIGPLLSAADNVFLTIFVAEITARLIAHGWRFWRDPWSVFDFAVVAIALVPATESLSVLRALRILRALRLISAIESMRRVVGALFRAIPGMAAIIMLLVLLLYVFSVMATQLYGREFPKLFGSIGDSAFTLFQVMTLEGWPDVARSVMDKSPWAWVFFIVFILITAFAVLNLFIGIIVDAMQEKQRADLDRIQQRQASNFVAEHKWTAGEFDLVLSEIRSLKEELHTLRRHMEAGSAQGKRGEAESDQS